MGHVAGPGTDRFLDRAGARALDRAAMDELGIPGIRLMENAALGATEIAREMIASGDEVIVLAGRGNNGGDGWAMARMLCNAGHPVRVCTLGPPREGSDAAANATRAETMDIAMSETLEPGMLEGGPLVIDALYGTGLDRPIEGDAASWIELVNDRAAPGHVLAVDLPSGLDSDEGTPLGPTIRAGRTATFVAPKIGMRTSSAEPYCGRIDVVGIGTPPALLDRFAIAARS